MTRRQTVICMGLGALLASFMVCGDLLAKESYKVQQGDTLWGIASKTGVTPAELKAANGLRESRLKPDQTLVIPSAKTKKVSKSPPTPPRRADFYVVKKKDTLAGIARKTGVSVAKLQEINRIPASALKIGQKLSLKSPEEPAELLAPYTGHRPEAADMDGALMTPDEALADIERRKKENEALLGKWSSPDEPKLLVKAAMGFLGAPYRMGGFSIRGIDCSGLVKKIYLLFDIDLPRTANEQSRVGMRVARNDLSEGDLLFFNTRRNGGHVGIYIGDNKFVHAASRKRGVRVDSLDAPYFDRRFIRAVRLKGSDDGL